MRKITWFYLCVAIVLTSCKKDEPVDSGTTTPYDLRDGIWWVNEGSFNGNNGSIDVVTDDGRIARDAFRQSNGSGLGDVLQKVNVFGDITLAVVNGSNQIVVMNTADMKMIRVISNLDYPRDAVIVGDFIYIAQGALAGKVGKFNLNNGAFVSEVSVGQGPERVLENNGKLWVLNSGGWGVDNSISIVDLSSFAVEQNLIVHDRPVDIDFDDQSGNIMVLCSGEVLYDANWNVTGHTAAAIYWINNFSYDYTYLELPSIGEHPRSIAWSANRQELYLANSGIDTYDGLGNEVCSGCWSGDSYTVDVDKQGVLWITSTPDFTSEGIMNKVSAESWSTIASYASGIGTSSVIDPR